MSKEEKCTKSCQDKIGGIKSVSFIARSDIKGYDKKGMPIMKRKYGKLKREIQTYKWPSKT